MSNSYKKNPVKFCGDDGIRLWRWSSADSNRGLSDSTINDYTFSTTLVLNVPKYQV